MSRESSQSKCTKTDVSPLFSPHLLMESMSISNHPCLPLLRSGVIECKEPIEVVSYKIGVCKVSSNGKECTTTFQKIGFNGHSSVVLCKPLTGRMHQIRVHLQYLGKSRVMRRKSSSS